VSVLAAAALILSALALNTASRQDRSATIMGSSGALEAASIASPMWDAGKLHAMEVRMDLAEAAQAEATLPMWDAGKLHAMEVRMDLAEAALAGRTGAT
jgi:hypothetical protein